jgi:methylated-DNA-protein-cysteine methyltransferase-like protein
MGAVNQYQAVYDIVAQIPYGHVSTYGALARMVYVPRGARGVGWALAIARQADLPWWRVVAAGGKITSPDAPFQYDLLCHEHVPMRAYLHVDIARCQWQPGNL